MALSVQSAIDTTFLDTAHFNAECDFSRARGFHELNDIVIYDVAGLHPFIIANKELKTQEFTVTALVTLQQEALLRDLYEQTVHPNYIDLRYPIVFSWGDSSGEGPEPTQYDCYLSDYEPPESVSYKSAEILSVKLTLRAI
ncbi:MAG: hypothetical protein IK038_02255 [Bacteroidaceae bacterium]|nr:hypothetical protein [Bacteroidaceae bacterium]